MKRDECAFGADMAERHDRWLATPAGALAQRLQHELLVRLLDPKWGESVLDVGCGTGETMKLLAGTGIRVTGIDRSPAMLAVARRKLGGAPLLVGDAIALPFADASFDAVLMNTTVEFLHEPAAAVLELTRVARRRIYLGVLNRWSLLGLHRRIRARWSPSVYQHARFFGVDDILHLLAAAGATRWRWGGVPYLPDALSRRAVLRRVVSAASGWPNPFAAYLGFAADVERLEAAQERIDRRIRVVATPDAAIARSGLRSR